MLEVLKTFLRGRAQDYTLCFRTTQGEAVLRDLAKFCRARTSTFHTDPRISAVMEGRSEVWLRITEHLNLSEDDLYNRYAAPAIPAVKGTSND